MFMRPRELNSKTHFGSSPAVCQLFSPNRSTLVPMKTSNASTELRNPAATNRRLRAGVAATEFAVAAPIMFLLIFASVEFSRMSMIRHAADNAAYEAARLAMVPGGTCAEGIAFAQQLLATHRIQNASIVISPDPVLETTEKIRVDVSIPMNGNAWFSRFSRDHTVSTYAELMTERVPVIQASSFVLPSATTSEEPTTEPPLI